MALDQQPMFQRELLKAQSKASMRGNRANINGLLQRLATEDLTRKDQFRRLGLRKESSDLHHSGRMQMQGMQKDDLRDRKKALPWTIGIGTGTALMSALEGRRRAQLIREETHKRTELRDLYKEQAKRQEIPNQILMNRIMNTEDFGQR